MASDIRIVVLDVGGVLVEDRGEQVLARWIRDPAEAARLRATWRDSPSLAAFESGRLSVDDFVDAFIAEMALAIERDAFIAAFSSLPGGLLPGVPALLAELRDRVTLASLSNTNALHWPRVSGELGIGRLIEHHFPSHETGNLKPARAAFAQVVEHFGCVPAAMLFLDDHEVNVEAALESGMDAAVARGPESARRILMDRGLL